MKTESFLLESVDTEIPSRATSLDSDQTVVLAFGTPHRDVAAGLVRRLIAAFPRSHVIGCSTAGEIFGAAIFDESLSVAVAKFETTKVRSGAVAVDGAANSEAAGEALMRGFVAEEKPRAVFVLSEGVHVNGSRLAMGMNRVAENVIITGGLAGDGDRFGATWVLSDGELRERTVTAIAFYGDELEVGHGSQGGWDRFGLALTATRTEQNVVYELDGQPALAVYRDYLGKLAAGLPATALLFPLTMQRAGESHTWLVRTVLAVDEMNQSLTFAGDIPSGARVHFMRAAFDRLIDGASEAAHMTANANARELAHEDTLSIAVSCVGRRLVLGQRGEEELDAAREALPRATTLVGFYSYGELSPVGSGQCELHNQTMTLTTFSEARKKVA